MKIKHVYGNVLRLDIPLTIKIRTMEDGVPTEREEPFYPDVSKGCAVILGSSYNRKIQYDATVSGNVAHIEDDGVICIGTYKVTVKCYDEQGNPYRYMVRDIIEICDATKDAGIEAGVEFNAETYTLEGAVFVSYGVEQVQSDWNEHDDESKAYIKNKPDLTQYATKEELREVESEIPTLPDHIVTDEHYVHTDNNYTSQDKQKLAGLENYDDSGIRQELDGKVDKVAGKGLSTNDFTNEDKSKLNSALQSETDPTVPSWAKQPNKPSYTAQEVGALPDSTKYGSTIDLAMDSATFVLTLSLKDQDGTVLNTKTVDLPIESVVVNGRYDAANKKIVLTLQSGSTIDVPVGDLIAGLQTEITSVNMLDADLVDDTNSTHKFVTTQEKQAWNNKSDFSGSYNDLSDKPTNVSEFTNDAGYLTQHQDISGKADKSEMSVVDGTGADADKTTITLKNGTSATVIKQHQDISGKQDTLVSGTNIKTINNESILGSGNISVAAELPSNLAYTSNDSGVGIVPEDGIMAETVTSAAAMTVNPDVVTVINGAVGTAAITLQVPNDNLAHVWDILLTTDSTVAVTFAMSNSETILYPNGFSVGASKAVEVSVIGVGTKYYLRYGEFA